MEQLLDWTARQIITGKLGATPKDAPPNFERRKIKPGAVRIVDSIERTKCSDNFPSSNRRTRLQRLASSEFRD
jgi:hypothetical protein